MKIIFLLISIVFGSTLLIGADKNVEKQEIQVKSEIAPEQKIVDKKHEEKAAKEREEKERNDLYKKGQPEWDQRQKDLKRWIVEELKLLKIAKLEKQEWLKKKYVDKATKNLKGLRLQLKNHEKMKDKYLPILEFKIGNVGVFRNFLIKIVQVIDKNSVIIEIKGKELYWNDVDTSKIVDGDELRGHSDTQLMKIIGNKTFDTRFGGTKTVYELKYYWVKKKNKKLNNRKKK